MDPNFGKHAVWKVGNLFSAFAQFSNNLWLAIMLVMLATAGVFWFLEHDAPDSEDFPHNEWKHMTVRRMGYSIFHRSVCPEDFVHNDIVMQCHCAIITIRNVPLAVARLPR